MTGGLTEPFELITAVEVEVVTVDVVAPVEVVTEKGTNVYQCFSTVCWLAGWLVGWWMGMFNLLLTGFTISMGGKCLLIGHAGVTYSLKKYRFLNGIGFS